MIISFSNEILNKKRTHLAYSQKVTTEYRDRTQSLKDTIIICEKLVGDPAQVLVGFDCRVIWVNENNLVPFVTTILPDPIAVQYL